MTNSRVALPQMNKKSTSLLATLVLGLLALAFSLSETPSSPNGQNDDHALGTNRSRKSGPTRSGSGRATLSAATGGTSHSTLPNRRAEARPEESQREAPAPSTVVRFSSSGSHWTVPGQCLARSARGDRVTYFSEFAEIGKTAEGVHEKDAAPWRIWGTPEVPSEAVVRVKRTLDAAESLAQYYLVGLERPAVYIHASVDALRDHACVASGALSYYDGAIHVALLDKYDEVAKSIHHELAHHLLTEMGFERPLWLHEGFAQRFASETVGSRPLTEAPLELDAMVERLGTKASQEELSAFYAQSSDMLEFLNQLPPVHGKRGYSALLEELRGALERGTAVPEDLFVWATVERGKNVVEGDPVDFWERYLASGGFTEATEAEIEREAAARLR